MEFTGQLENNHIIIERLKQELFSLSEMGGIIDDSAFGASQGYEGVRNTACKCENESTQAWQTN